MKPRITVFIALLLSAFTSHSQAFENVTDDLGVDVFNTSPTLGYGVSFYDFDNDGWDDLSFCQENDSLVFYKNVEGTFVQMPSIAYAWADSKSVTWADYDNDGDADLLVTQYLGLTQLFRNDGDWNFTDVTIDAGIPQDPLAKSFGVSWADYDRDGWLDVYICNFNWNDGMTNWCMHNNGDGTFTEVGLDLGLDNGSFPSYQSAWIDHNNDQWPDLYVINDFLPQNALYENNGDGTFTDISEASGMDISIEAMSIAANDYDNDGDLDVYMTNNTAGNYFMENDGNGMYANVAPDLGITVNDLCWGSLWIDYDNNGWDDLYVATSFGSGDFSNHFFTNDNGAFTAADDVFGVSDQAVSFSNAKGDINNDGFYDIVQTNASSQHSFVYQNLTMGNNSVKVTLEGTTSNRNAVGAWIATYVNGVELVEYTQLGQNFLGQNSQHVILPCGAATQIDSLVITWPNGLEEMYNDLPAGSSHTIVEGETIFVQTLIDGPTEICTGQTSMLSIEGQFQSVEWSTGDMGNTLVVDEPGTYYAEVTDSNGYVFVSTSIVIEDLAAASPTISVAENACFGEANASINLISEDVEIAEISWLSGQDSTYIDGLVAGWYTYSLVDINSCGLTDSIEIVDPQQIEYVFEVTPVSCFGLSDGSAELEISGGTGELEIEVNDADLEQLSAGTYPVLITDSNSCTVNFEIVVSEPDEMEVSSDVVAAMDADGSVSIEVSGGTEPYTILWNTGDSDVLSLEDISAGVYSVWIMDANGCSIFIEAEVPQLVSVQEEALQELRIYPNPATSTFTIELNENAQGLLKIVDAQGKCVGNHSTNGSRTIDISNLAKGLYSLVWTDAEGQRITKQLVVK